MAFEDFRLNGLSEELVEAFPSQMVQYFAKMKQLTEELVRGVGVRVVAVVLMVSMLLPAAVSTRW